MLWDVASGQALRRWRKHVGRVNAVRFAGPAAAEGELAPTSSLLLLSVGVDGMLLAWDVRARSQYPIQVSFADLQDLLGLGGSTSLFIVIADYA